MKEILTGKPYPMGATVCETGVNFALFSAHATAVELCLFDEHGTETRCRLPARSGFIWHGFVENIGAGQRYGYRVYGEYAPEKGWFFNPQKLLIDPYSKALDGEPVFRNAEELAWYRPEDARDNAHIAPKSIVVGKSHFDWGNDVAPDIPWGQTVIYEAHVKGFTQQFPDLQHAGTYRALCDERVIQYLKNLGITTIELLPIHEHIDERHLQTQGLRNHWGYNTYSHFAVERDYAVDVMQAADEFRSAVKALHQAGLEVILDVVYNHTAESDLKGAMLCQRGIDNTSWYWVNPETGNYFNWAGTGNALKMTRRDILRWAADSLRYWVEEFHVDGFRFDLGTVMAREPEFNVYRGFFSLLYQDPVLANKKLIVEAWDIGDNGYHLGGFAYPYAEWNGAFRDDVRRFWCWQSGDLGALATRWAGSSDLFHKCGRQPAASLNFITAHDGFTLRDLVSYNHKHNEANGEQNRDGHNDNISNNHGTEGETNNPLILKQRLYTSKALLATLLLSNGTPMLLSGDELGNTQSGNNNAYCQDNSITWIDWQAAKSFADLHDYVRDLIALRREIDILNRNQWFDDEHVIWCNVHGLPMSHHDWADKSQKAMQIQLDGQWLICINGKRDAASFRLPAPQQWQLRLAPSNDCDLSAKQLHVSHMGVWVLQAACTEHTAP